tara:strand:+ start:195 stop:449 length:255 start_codon:yes stop_codon:yes gene_type:complete
MKKVKSIKKEELTKLQELVKNFNQHQLKIGELEIEKHQVLHSSSAIQSNLQEFQEELRKDYGDVTIDISNGEYKEVEDGSDTKN